jgi:hypothetical protein
MYLATRKIRSAGRTSGSIEITLPAELHLLEGIDCRLSVRDGIRPEIVLQPELSAAQSVFESMWQMLRVGLSDIDEIGDFSVADFTLTLFPPTHWQERPPLACADALAVIRDRANRCDRESPAVIRLLSFLAIVAGQRLGLSGSLALAFGDAVAYIITGISAGLGIDFERGLAHRAFWGDRQATSPGSPFDPAVWEQARPGFRRVLDQFRRWQSDPDIYAAARENWYRALSMEVGNGIDGAPIQLADY